MKTKYLFIILIVVGVLFGYNLWCYKFANNNINKGTKGIIERTLGNDYEYIVSTLNEDESINVFVKKDKDYYRFIVVKNGPSYILKEYNKDIPSYVKNRYIVSI